PSFAVGRLVPWAQAGVGAIALQGTLDPSFGAEGLYLLRNGKTALNAMQALIAADPDRSYRQVAMVDANGNAISWTGESASVSNAAMVGPFYAACVAQKACPPDRRA